jgi:ketosteroid isomerase-like protein
MTATAASTGIEHLICMVEGAGDPAAVRDNIARLGAEVLPRLRDHSPCGRRRLFGGCGHEDGVGGEMPWFPDFTSAVELVRKQTRAAGHADPVGEYFAALNDGDPHVLETVWPGEVVIYDPRAGEVRGHRQVQQFVRHNLSWLAGLHARAETVASTVVGGRAVVELLAHLDHDGRKLAWPIAVVAESPDDRSVVFRTYCSQWPVDEQRHFRPAILKPGDAHPGDVVGRHLAAVTAGDVEAAVGTFAPDGHFRGPFGSHDDHRGAGELRSFFTECFSAGGGIGLEHCVVTDDGVRCALEYNCVRWGVHDLRPQAGIGVYERGPDGLLAAARVYDDIEPPAESPLREETATWT